MKCNLYLNVNTCWCSGEIVSHVFTDFFLNLWVNIASSISNSQTLIQYVLNEEPWVEVPEAGIPGIKFTFSFLRLLSGWTQRSLYVVYICRNINLNIKHLWRRIFAICCIFTQIWQDCLLILNGETSQQYSWNYFKPTTTLKNCLLEWVQHPFNCEQFSSCFWNCMENCQSE